jgi:hypothetical protein
MRILNLNTFGVSNAIAKAMFNKKNAKLYFNIILGFRGYEYKMYTLYLSQRHFKAKKSMEELELKDNNYILQPIKINGELQKDTHNNPIYCIYCNDVNNYKKDIILIWEIPNKLYTNVKYEIKGDVTKLAEASYGQERDGVNYISPIPVLEIFGDCELTWSGIDKHSVKVGQIIKYNYVLDQWDIKSLSAGEKE